MRSTLCYCRKGFQLYTYPYPYGIYIFRHHKFAVTCYFYPHFQSIIQPSNHPNRRASHQLNSRTSLNQQLAPEFQLGLSYVFIYLFFAVRISTGQDSCSTRQRGLREKNKTRVNGVSLLLSRYYTRNHLYTHGQRVQCEDSTDQRLHFISTGRHNRGNGRLEARGYIQENFENFLHQICSHQAFGEKTSLHLLSTLRQLYLLPFFCDK